LKEAAGAAAGYGAGIKIVDRGARSIEMQAARERRRLSLCGWRVRWQVAVRGA
jgi:hypothetical protein